MKLIELFSAIQFVDNGWAFGAFVIVMIYLYITR